MLKVECEHGFLSVACAVFVFAFSIFMSNSAFARDVNYSVTVSSSLTITVPTNTVVLNLNPNSNSADTGSINVTVVTNNPTGYKLTMSSQNNATDLVRNSSLDGKTDSIPTLSSQAGTTPDSLTNNAWGYRKNNTGNFIPYASGATIKETDTSTAGDTTTLNFAAKVDYEKLAGTYSRTLTFAGVTNPLTPYIQNLNPDFCTETPLTVLDKRDDQEYIVQRLKDGTCWMMTNLNLGAIDLTTELNSTNTNVTDPVSASVFNSWKKSSVRGTSSEPEFIPVTSANSSTHSDTDPTSGTKYGTLYNFCVVSANTVCGSSGEALSEDATSDICPAGWRLPTGGSGSSEFAVLYARPEYNNYSKLRAPIANGGAAFALAGYINAGTPANQNTAGRYWSSTAAGSSSRYVLYVDVNSSRISSSYSRFYAQSVRCVLNDTREIDSLDEIQNINPTLCTEDPLDVVDKRDKQKYTIQRLKDGNCWMVTNLNLGAKKITADLDSSNTNITGTIAAGTFNGWKKASVQGINTAPEFASVTSYASSTSSDTDPTSLIKYGTLYNYCAASANTICGSSNDTDATQDICPAGWRLPTGGTASTAEFKTLYAQTEYNTYAKLRAPIASGGAAFALAGYINAGTPANQNTAGRYWSSTAVNATARYVMYVDVNSANAAGNYSRFYSHAVRCIRKSN